MNINEFEWARKYQPKTLDECILPPSTKAFFQSWIDQGFITSCTLSGRPGLGKTSSIIAVLNDLQADYLFINAVKENSIDTLRTKIQQYASTMSIFGGRKYVLLDEGDRLSPLLADGLKGFIEEVSSNCGFIITCNTSSRLIEPLTSRCPVIDMNITADDYKSVLQQFTKRAFYILEQEGVAYERTVVAKLIQNKFPDLRKVLNTLQIKSNSNNKVIDVSVLGDISNNNIKELIKLIKARDFTSICEWVSRNTSTEPSIIFRGIYDELVSIIKPESVANLVIILADYNYKSTFAVDQEINTKAAIAEIMGNVQIG